MYIERTGADYNTSLCHTYHMQQLGDETRRYEQSHYLNATLMNFLDLEAMRISPLRSLMTPDASVAWYKVRKSIKFGNNHYVVDVSWWDERSSLPINGPLAEKRPESTKRKLSEDPKIAGA